VNSENYEVSYSVNNAFLLSIFFVFDNRHRQSLMKIIIMMTATIKMAMMVVVAAAVIVVAVVLGAATLAALGKKRNRNKKGNEILGLYLKQQEKLCVVGGDTY
jgi:signal transduction histidine kinase